MVDFEKIGDTFEEGFEKVKDFSKKNKVLTIAICGVGAFALYKLFMEKTSSEDTEYVSTYAYVPTGYDGYPTMSESVSYDDVVDQLRNETADINKELYEDLMSDVTEKIEDMQIENENKFDSIIESISGSGYGENLTTMSYLEEQRKRQEIVDRMSANSEAWYSASDEEKAQLHEENKILGAILGADFDSVTGSWSQDGQTLYNVSVKNKTNTSTSGLTNVGVIESPVNEADIVSQMKVNSEAWHTASDTERAKLEAENKHLGSLIGASYNSASGTWSNSTGSTLYTVESGTTKTSSTSTNVRTSSKKKTSSSSSSDVIAQMKANSEAWHSASDSEKQNLANKNQELGKSIGATYNSASGTWSKDGKNLY